MSQSPTYPLLFKILLVRLSYSFSCINLSCSGPEVKMEARPAVAKMEKFCHLLICDLCLLGMVSFPCLPILPPLRPQDSYCPGQHFRSFLYFVLEPVPAPPPIFLLITLSNTWQLETKRKSTWFSFEVNSLV